MEKRISFRDFQSVKSVAKAIDPKLREKAMIEKEAFAFKEEADRQIAALKERHAARAAKIKEKYDNCQAQIDALEAGILTVTGFHVSDLVKKVIEPTGKTDKNGKPLKETKYLPTGIVSYDDTAKQYVITISDGHKEETIVPPTTEGMKGSDYDADKEELEKESTENPEDELPFSNDDNENIF